MLENKARRRMISGPIAAVLAMMVVLTACVENKVQSIGAPEAQAIDGAIAVTSVSDLAFSPEIAAGEQALASGNPAQARRAFEIALNKRPDDPRAVIGMADSLLAFGDLEGASRLYRGVRPGAAGLEARLLQGKGIVALRQQDAASAVSLLERSVALNRSLWRAWLALGQARDQIGRSGAARQAYLSAEEKAPARPAVFNDIGMSYLFRRQFNDAARYFERALTIDQSFTLARNNLRIAKAWTGAYADAVSGAPKEELADVLNNVGYVAILRKDFAVADQYLRRAVSISPIYHEAAVANLDLLARVSAGTAGVGPVTAEIPNAVPKSISARQPSESEASKQFRNASAANQPRRAPAVPPPLIEPIDPVGVRPAPTDKHFKWSSGATTVPHGMASTREKSATRLSSIETSDIPPPSQRVVQQSDTSRPLTTDQSGPNAKAQGQRSFTWEEPSVATRSTPKPASAPAKIETETVQTVPVERVFQWIPSSSEDIAKEYMVEPASGQSFKWSR